MFSTNNQNFIELASRKNSIELEKIEAESWTIAELEKSFVIIKKIDDYTMQAKGFKFTF